MITNTKTLFCALLKALRADCVCDIGSRDGAQAVLFREVCPSAAVIAFEANPINYRAMAQTERLHTAKIQLVPYAAFNTRGTACFHVTDVDYTDATQNTGTSSLLVHDALKIRETVEIETVRLDEFIATTQPQARCVGLWIDVEGAEFEVLSGIAGIKERVAAVHVETARVPLRRGQRVMADVEALLRDMGFVPCGSNLEPQANWGDVVFVNTSVARALGPRLRLCQFKALAGNWVRADQLAVRLKLHSPWLYRTLRKWYVRLMT